MSEKIDRLVEHLRIKFHGIDRRLEALKGNRFASSEKSRDVVESQMDTVQQRIFDRRHAVEAANASVKAWIAKHFDGQNRFREADADGSAMSTRADDAEGCAFAAFELAVAAADEAAQAALEALLARDDAEIATFREGGRND